MFACGFVEMKMNNNNNENNNTEILRRRGLVVDENGEPIIENNKILLLKKEDNTLVHVALTKDIKKAFNLEVTSDESEEHICNELQLDEEDRDDQYNLFNPICEYDCGTEVVGKGSEKFAWSNKSVLLFLDEYKAKMARFRNPRVKKKMLWEEISNTMKKKGYEVDPDALDRKMRNMKKTYRTILDNNNKKKTTGTGRIQWEYFTYFEDMLQEDKTVNLPSTMISTTRLNEVTHEQSDMDSLEEHFSSRSSTPLAKSSCETHHSSNITSYKTLEKSSCETPRTLNLTNKAHQAKRLDVYRKRQLEIEEEKLSELKKLREGITESNKLQREKIEWLKKIVENKK